MFDGFVRLVVSLCQLWLRFIKPSSTRGFQDILGSSVALHGSNPRSSELVAVLASDVGTAITTKVPLNGLEGRRRSISRYLHRRVTEPPPHGFN
jgi:hypothetical protein